MSKNNPPSPILEISASVEGCEFRTDGTVRDIMTLMACTSYEVLAKLASVDGKVSPEVVCIAVKDFLQSVIHITDYHTDGKYSELIDKELEEFKKRLQPDIDRVAKEFSKALKESKPKPEYNSFMTMNFTTKTQ